MAQELTIVLETQSLTRRFNGRTAVDELTMTAESGEIFILLGPNGAGKSTTIKMLNTLLPPTSGSARVAGFNIVRQAEDVRRVIGYVPHDRCGWHAHGLRESLDLCQAIRHSAPTTPITHPGGYRLHGAERRRGPDGETVFRRYDPPSGDRPVYVTPAASAVSGRADWWIGSDCPQGVLGPPDPTSGYLRQDGYLTTHLMEEEDAFCSRLAIMNQTTNSPLKCSRDERVHAGEFLRLLHEFAPDEEKFYAEGVEEVDEEIKKMK